MPVCFRISFTNTMMNNARSLVHVYSDGSVCISTGAVEMGQGVNTKILQVAAQTFAIAPEKIKLTHTSTYTIANTSPSAASSTSDLNGKATLMACTAILERLKKVAADGLQVTEEDISLVNEQVLVKRVHLLPGTGSSSLQVPSSKGVNLSEHAHYTTLTK